MCECSCVCERRRGKRGSWEERTTLSLTCSRVQFFPSTLVFHQPALYQAGNIQRWFSVVRFMWNACTETHQRSRHTCKYMHYWMYWFLQSESWTSQNRILALLALITRSFCGSVDICDTILCEDGHTVHYSQFSLDYMCIYVCVLPHLAENIDGFVLIEEPHDDTNILLLKSKIEVQQYIQLSYLLPPLLPSSPHPFLASRLLLSFCLATSLPPTQTSLPLSSLLFSSSCAPPIPLLYTNFLSLP